MALRRGSSRRELGVRKEALRGVRKEDVLGVGSEAEKEYIFTDSLICIYYAFLIFAWTAFDKPKFLVDIHT